MLFDRMWKFLSVPRPVRHVNVLISEYMSVEISFSDTCESEFYFMSQYVSKLKTYLFAVKMFF